MGKEFYTDEIEKGSIRLFQKAVEKRVRFLSRVLREKSAIKDLWPGKRLRISKKAKGFQYYLKEEGGKGSGRYLSAKEQKIICGIITRDYDLSVRKAAETELNMLTQYLSFAVSGSVNHIYEKQSVGRKQVIKPVYPSDEQCLERWEKISADPPCPYEKTGDIFTEKGEQVRSKSEVLIADALYHAGVPYHYEYPLKLHTGELFYPDFTILDLPNRKIYYWEHFGKMGDREYLNKTLIKIRTYEENGIWPGEKLLMTFESPDVSLGTKEIKNIIAEYFSPENGR